MGVSQAFGLVAVVVVCAPGVAQTFEDVSIEAFGVPPVHKQLDTTLGLVNMSGGLAVADLNRDGHQDVFVLRGEFAADQLFLNNGDGTFVEASVAAGVDHRHKGAGVAVGDYDGDGWPDMYVTSLGSVNRFEPGVNRLYRGLGLDADGFTPLFEEVAQEAGVHFSNPHSPDGFGAAFGDYDLDGDLDLATGGWNWNDCPNAPDPHARSTTGTRLFRNNGDGTFTDVTVAVTPLTSDECWPDGFEDIPYIQGFAPRFADMNNDRFPDLLITADNGWTSDYLHESLYLLNNGDGTFSDMTNVPGSGLGLDSNGMGQAVGDLDHDGDLDWYVTSICQVNGATEGNSCNVLYLNNGDNTFTEVAKELGLEQGYWGWGTEIIDVDLDGWPDVVETNGWWIGNLSMQPTRYWRHNGLTPEGELLPFTDVAPAASGLDFTGQGRALVRLDYDSDGDIDVILLPNSTLPNFLGEPDQPLKLYSNRTRENAAAGDANYLRLFLDTGAHPCLAPDGIGARVELSVEGEPTQMQELSPGSTYNAQSETSVHFGLGSDVDTCHVLVTWPNGLQTELEAVPVNQTLTLAAPCVADTNGDGTLNVLDFIAFQTAFLAGDEPAADVNCDLGLSILDFVRYQELFAAGCE